MKLIVRFIVLPTILSALALTVHAQLTPEPRTDVSDKALITKTTPPAISPAPAKSGPGDIAALRKMADDYYTWRNENYPVFSSDSGLHTWDNRLTDYSTEKITERAQHVRRLLDQVRAHGDRQLAEG